MTVESAAWYAVAFLVRGAPELDEIVARALGDDPALARLRREVDGGEPRPRTMKRVQLAIEDAAEEVPEFADALTRMVEKLQGAEPTDARLGAQTKRELYAQLLRIQERTSDPEASDTLATRAWLAHWSGEAGDADAAREEYAALLAKAEPVWGAEHRDTLSVRANLAYWTGRAGGVRAALHQYATLLPAYERVLGPEHPETLTVHANLARWTGENGDASAARALYTRLLPIRERVLGTDHPETRSTRANLAYWTEADC